ncbi:MAG: two-component system response regulator RegA [Halioglobus sp.]|jgi:two-component system response regulator RegA
MSTIEKRILLVDDDVTFTEVMSRGFTRRGFEVQTCNAAKGAVNACKAWHPDLILLDLNMPDSSGLVILPDLLSAAPEASLVVLTGYSSIATAVQATKAGALNYLCKPATIEEILRCFRGEGTTPTTTEIPAEPLSVDRLEWEHIQRVLQDNDGNISAAARALNMHRRTLQRKLYKRPVRH